DQKQWPQALDAFGRATAILNGRRSTEAETPTRADLKLHEDTNPFPGLIVAAYNLAGTADGQKAAALRSQAFEAAQWIGDEQAARAIAGMSARVAAGNGDLSARIRERQDLSEQAQAIDKALVALLSQPATPSSPQNEQTLRAEAASIANEIRERD